MVDPRLDRVVIVSATVNLELRTPAVIRQRLQPLFPPVRITRGPVEQGTGYQVMTVGENIRLDPDPLTNHALNCKSARIDFRTYRFDDRPQPSLRNDRT